MQLSRGDSKMVFHQQIPGNEELGFGLLQVSPLWLGLEHCEVVACWRNERVGSREMD
jgi:hypothetical protein